MDKKSHHVKYALINITIVIMIIFTIIITVNESSDGNSLLQSELGWEL